MITAMLDIARTRMNGCQELFFGSAVTHTCDALEVSSQRFLMTPIPILGSMIEREDILQLVRWLSWKHGIEAPAVVFSRGSDTGMYYPHTRSIHVSRRTSEWVVLHEFAHHAVEMARPGKRVPWRRLRQYRGMRANGSKRVHHGPLFVAMLRQIARDWYGSTTAYPLAGEYACVKKAWALMDEES